ncbi:MAG: beta strand repeat-containing protein, partial [Erythrobacter sp.]
MARSTHRRTPLLLGGAGLAVAAILALPSPVGAQAFNGSPVFVRGSGNVDRSVPNVDTITISSATAVLDWTVFEDNFGNALTFLPTGHTAFFQDTPGQGGFAVLNRILPSTNGNVVVFDGTVVSRLLAADSTRSSGGTVAFYSPTGILVGGNAVFDVGQLLLTTLDPDLDSFDNYAAGGTLQLAGAPGATAAVDIASGAQITANGEGSYFAVAAPQILMRGNAYINGTTAYVAGEQVNLTYNNGLFDIQIPVGTSVGTPIDHSGTTGGPSSTGSGDNHLIYAVSRAAANPIAMLLRGNLGFDTAATAGVDNGDIILSAGYDVFGRSVPTGPVDSGAVLESITILGPTMLTSSVLAGATGHFDANSNDGAIDFADDLTVRAARSISLAARNGNDLAVAGDSSFEAEGTIAASGDVTGGDISLTARGAGSLSFFGNLSAFATPTQRDGSSTGGTIGLVADNGTLAVDGEVMLFAQANNFFPTGTLGDGSGGTISLLSRNGGLIDLGSSLHMDTNAFGNGFAGRTATAGANEIVAQSGGRIDIAGSVSLQASGFGGDADGTSGVIDGGAGFGGFIQILADGGSISFGSTLSMGADGIGGNGASIFGAGPGDFGGLGQGGQILINAIDGSIVIADDVSLVARGFGGQGGSGGNGIGGLAQVFADGSGSIDLMSVSASAHGFGGDGSGNNGRGGDAGGGQSIILTLGTGDISVTGDASMQANSFGGDGHTGGDAVGGNAGIYAVFGSIAIDGNASVHSLGFGGDATVGFGGNGGNAIGGTSYLQADGSESAGASLVIGGNGSIDASGFGGIGGAGDGIGIAAGMGGNGTGGIFQGQPGTGGAFAIAGRDNAILVIGGSTVVSARGTGGAGGVGGAGQSGGAGGVGTGGTTQAGTFIARGDGSLGAGRATFAALWLDASGTGGAGGSGAAGLGLGGIGQGGTAGVFAIESQVDADDVTTIADGSGGAGSTGGDGIGGDAGIGIVSGSLFASNLFARANGTGGSATPGVGGDGIGGEAWCEMGCPPGLLGGGR